MQATVCGKIKNASLYSALDATASLMYKVERIYFREHFVPLAYVSVSLFWSRFDGSIYKTTYF